MAFVQLLVAGMALATRFEESKVVKTVIKEVPKLIAVRVPVEQERASPVISRPPMPEPAVSLAMPPPTPITLPKVADPRSERMVREAKQARVAGDMGAAIMKLEDALTHSPDDPTVHFELGLVHEQMGVYDIASAHYEKVMQMNISGAGALYELAAAKLRDGFREPSFVGKLSLGRVQIFNDPENETGQRVILTIPVQKAPGEEIDPGKVSVEVLFFNRTAKEEIVQLEERSWSQERWLNPPFDWAVGEETVRATYTIPPQDHQTEHLFGERAYYGQVVILHYGNEVLDVQAWPPSLAAKIPRQPASTSGDPLQPEFQDTLPLDFDPTLGVLPPFPTQ